MIKHDEQGFLVGERLSLEGTQDMLAAIKSEIEGLRGDLSGLAGKDVALPIGNTASAPTINITVPTQAEAKTQVPTVAPASSSSTDNRAVIAGDTTTNNTTTSINRSSDNRRTSSTTITPVATPVSGAASALNTDGSKAITQIPKAAGQREHDAYNVTANPVAVATPLSGAKRDAKGRFLPKDAEATKTSGSDDAVDSQTLKTSIGDMGAKIASAVQTPVSGESDPSIQALNEVAQPLQRGFGMVFGGDKDKGTDRWYRRFWRDARERKKLQKKHNKRQIELLEDIEKHGDGKKGGGILGFFAPLLRVILNLIKALLPLKLLSALKNLPGLGGAAGAGAGRKNKGKKQRAGKAQGAKGQGRTGSSQARTNAGQSGSPRTGGALGRGAKGLARRIPLLGALLTLGSTALGVRKSETDQSTTRREKDINTGAAVGRGTGALTGAVAGGVAGAAVGSVIPVVGNFIGGVVGAGLGAWLGEDAGDIIGAQFGEWVNDLRSSDFLQGMSDSWDTMTAFTGHLWGKVSKNVGQKWDTMAASVSDKWDTVTTKLADISDTLVEKWDSALSTMKEGWNKVTDLAKDWWGSAKDVANKANDAIKNATGIDVKETVKKAGTAAKEAVTSTAISAWDAVKRASDKAGNFAKESLSKVGEATGVSRVARSVSQSASYATNITALKKQMAEAGINDPNEAAAFLGQMDHESGGLTKLEENLNYKPEQFLKIFGKRAGITTEAEAAAIIAQGKEAQGEAMYGGAWGARNLGNTEKGDGFAFRGRGFTQLTGRDNYTAASKALGIDLVNNPDMAAEPEVAAQIATWYWQNRAGLSEAGKAGDVEAVTRKINGGTHGLADRTAKTAMYAQDIASGKLTIPTKQAEPEQPAVVAQAEPELEQPVELAQVNTAEASSHASAHAMGVDAFAPIAVATAPVAHPAIPRMAAPTVPAATAINAAPEVRTPMTTPSKERPATQGHPEVSRDLTDRRIAHVVTGAYSHSGGV